MFADRQHCPRKELEAHAVTEVPAREVDRQRAAVGDLDPLVVGVLRRWQGRGRVVGDLTDDDVLVERKSVWRVRGRRRGIEPRSVAGRRPTTIATGEFAAVEHGAPPRIVDEQLLTIGGPETEGRTVNEQARAGRQSPGRKRVFAQRVARSGYRDAPQLGCHRSCVDQFDPEARHRRGRHLIDHQLRGSVPVREILSSRRASQFLRERPILRRLVRGVGAELGQGGARSIGRCGPAAVVAIVELVHQAVALVDQPQGLAAVVEAAGEGSELARAGAFCHHEVIAGIDERALGENVSYAVEPPAGDIGLDPHLVEQLDPLASLGCSGRVVMHLVDHHHRVRRRGRTVEADRWCRRHRVRVTRVAAAEYFDVVVKIVAIRVREVRVGAGISRADEDARAGLHTVVQGVTVRVGEDRVRAGVCRAQEDAGVGLHLVAQRVAVGVRERRIGRGAQAKAGDLDVIIEVVAVGVGLGRVEVRELNTQIEFLEVGQAVAVVVGAAKPGEHAEVSHPGPLFLP